MDYIYEKDRIYLKNALSQVIAEVSFPELLDGICCIEHTFVDDSLRGQGIAPELVRRAVEEIERRHKKVIATCTYAKKWLDKNGYVQDCLS